MVSCVLIVNKAGPGSVNDVHVLTCFVCFLSRGSGLVTPGHMLVKDVDLPRALFSGNRSRTGLGRQWPPCADKGAVVAAARRNAPGWQQSRAKASPRPVPGWHCSQSTIMVTHANTCLLAPGRARDGDRVESGASLSSALIACHPPHSV